MSGHIEHVEDLIFNNGINGARETFEFLKITHHAMVGDDDTTEITTKWDGAPAIFCGLDPADGEFFVAKKSIMNVRDQKIYKSQDDLLQDQGLSSELKTIFSACLKYLKPVLNNIPPYTIVSGDLMFYPGGRKYIDMIDGVRSVVMNPNTIVYSVPIDSKLGRKIQVAKLGVIWHTQYSIKSLDDMRGSPTRQNISTATYNRIGKNPSVWQDSARLQSNEVVNDHELKDPKLLRDRTRQETSDAGRILQTIQRQYLEMFTTKPINELIKVYNNSYVRSGNPKSFAYANHIADNFIPWIKDRKMNEKEKTDILKKISTVTAKSELRKIYGYYLKIIQAKKSLMLELKNISSVATHVRTTQDGYVVTSPEGYVVVGVNKNTVKLVDRFEFSFNNFSPTVLKGWQ